MFPIAGIAFGNEIDCCQKWQPQNLNSKTETSFAEIPNAELCSLNMQNSFLACSLEPLQIGEQTRNCMAPGLLPAVNTDLERVSWFCLTESEKEINDLVITPVILAKPVLLWYTTKKVNSGETEGQGAIGSKRTFLACRPCRSPKGSTSCGASRGQTPSVCCIDD